MSCTAYACISPWYRSNLSINLRQGFKAFAFERPAIYQAPFPPVLRHDCARVTQPTVVVYTTDERPIVGEMARQASLGEPY